MKILNGFSINLLYYFYFKMPNKNLLKKTKTNPENNFNLFRIILKLIELSHHYLEIFMSLSLKNNRRRNMLKGDDSLTKSLDESIIVIYKFHLFLPYFIPLISLIFVFRFMSRFTLFLGTFLIYIFLSDRYGFK